MKFHFPKKNAGFFRIPRFESSFSNDLKIKLCNETWGIVKPHISAKLKLKLKY